MSSKKRIRAIDKRIKLLKQIAKVKKSIGATSKDIKKLFGKTPRSMTTVELGKVSKELRQKFKPEKPTEPIKRRRKPKKEVREELEEILEEELIKRPEPDKPELAEIREKREIIEEPAVIKRKLNIDDLIKLVEMEKPEAKKLGDELEKLLLEDAIKDKEAEDIGEDLEKKLLEDAIREEKIKELEQKTGMAIERLAMKNVPRGEFNNVTKILKGVLDFSRKKPVKKVIEFVVALKRDEPEIADLIFDLSKDALKALGDLLKPILKKGVQKFRNLFK